jgi:hypothetical protein
MSRTAHTATARGDGAGVLLYLDYIKDPELKKKLTPDYNLGRTASPSWTRIEPCASLHSRSFSGYSVEARDLPIAA